MAGTAPYWRGLSDHDRSRRGIAHLAIRRIDFDPAQMRMGGEIGHGVDLGKGDVGIRELVQQFVAHQFGKTVADRLVGRRAVADALDHVGETGIAGQIRLAEHLGAELLPFALALDRDQNSLAVL